MEKGTVMSAAILTQSVWQVLALRVLAAARAVLLGLTTFSLEVGILPEVLSRP